MNYNPLFDLPDLGKRDIPKREDHPLILAWLRPCTDPLQRCERKNCHRMAYVEASEYEDRSIVEREMSKGGIILIHEVEDKLWRHTVEEQLAGKYTVYQTAYHCRDHMLGLLMAFLNTNKNEELAEVLDHMRDKNYTLVQWHKLSFPALGLCAIMKAPINTPEEFLAWLKRGPEVNWKLQK